jgi:hypothetical protein
MARKSGNERYLLPSTLSFPEMQAAGSGPTTPPPQQQQQQPHNFKVQLCRHYATQAGCTHGTKCVVGACMCGFGSGSIVPWQQQATTATPGCPCISVQTLHRHAAHSTSSLLRLPTAGAPLHTGHTS